MLIKTVFLVAVVAVCVRGHGMMVDPPARNTAWRYGFPVPRNDNDNEQFCGGFAVQWGRNDGKCGACGDPYDQKDQKHVAPGEYATGTIVRTYTEGQVIKVKVKITANHKGSFTFRIGDIGTPPITQTKLRYVLQLADGSGTKWPIPLGNKIFEVDLKLPEGLVCNQCVIQWWYTVGNNWGCDSTGCGLGKNPKQECFVNCADVKILAKDGTKPKPPPTQPPMTTIPLPPTTNPPPQPTVSPGGECRGAGPWLGSPVMDEWCNQNCKIGNCPPSHCQCT